MLGISQESRAGLPIGGVPSESPVVFSVKANQNSPHQKIVKSPEKLSQGFDCWLGGRVLFFSVFVFVEVHCSIFVLAVFIFREIVNRFWIHNSSFD